MKNDQVQTLNYCAHALEALREQELEMRSLAPQTARVFRRLIDMLQHSVKFILPNCCNLIDPQDLKQAHLDLTRLPFPCVAFEVPWEIEVGVDQLGGFAQTPATKRIALCWEPNPQYEIVPGLYSILGRFPEGGVFILPIYWMPEFRTWTVALGGTFVPYDNTLRHVTTDKTGSITHIAHMAAIDAGLADESKKSKQFIAEPFVLLQELYPQVLAACAGNVERVYAQILLDSRDETTMLVQACSVINCANVTTAEISPSASLNKRREEKGKQPFFSYKVLQLSEDERRELAGNRLGGNHASPRRHLRRGHLRRLENKVIWVRPALVNAAATTGVVLKDYAVLRKGA